MYDVNRSIRNCCKNIALMVTFGLFSLPLLAAEEAKIHPSLVIEFTENGRVVTPAMKEKMKDFISNVRLRNPGKEDAIDKVYVAAWADRQRMGEESLTDRETKLAEDRAKHVKAYLKNSLKVKSVEDFNMAERANVFSRAVNNEDARVKGDTGPVKDTIAALIQNHAQASTVVLVVDERLRHPSVSE
jgi:hypothetical protein